jgi:hypothetical protein
MNLEYVPLLQLQRDLHALPRDRARFRQYLQAIFSEDGTIAELPSLIAMNPMGKEHVAERLDDYLALDADGIAARATTEAAARLAELPGNCKVTLVIVDDLKGGWTNRYAEEFTWRFQSGPADPPALPRWLKQQWITGILWSSEAASQRVVREAALTAIYRSAYVQQHGPARTLRERMDQEGHVMTMAGCAGPVLDDEDIAYTREVIEPCLDDQDKRTTIECLFGDAAGGTLGFTPRGLSPWAGLALALYDARNELTVESIHDR